MNARTYFAVSITFLFVTAISASEQKITTDYDHNANFSQYRSYSWLRIKTPDAIWDQHLEDAVDKQLQARGWKKILTGGGDVAVTAFGSTQDNGSLQAFYSEVGSEWQWQGIGSNSGAQDYEVGTLIVDLFDARSKRLIWRATASDTVSDDPNKDPIPLDKAAAKMFQEFPPAAGAK